MINLQPFVMLMLVDTEMSWANLA